MSVPDDRLTIQQAAEALGLSVYTLRYYERIGLIHPITREENTHRRYSAQDIGWIDFLTKLRAAGMSIRQMQAYADLQRQGDGTLPARLAILRDHRRQVEERLKEMQEHLRIIRHKIEYYEGVMGQGS